MKIIRDDLQTLVTRWQCAQPTLDRVMRVMAYRIDKQQEEIDLLKKRLMVLEQNDGQPLWR